MTGKRPAAERRNPHAASRKNDEMPNHEGQNHALAAGQQPVLFAGNPLGYAPSGNPRILTERCVEFQSAR
jgi:hypothetical protein